MPELKDVNEVFKQLTEILEKSLLRISEVEQHISKDLESIRRQLDAVGVLKDNIANLNNRIDLLSKKLTELSKSEPQELSRLLLRAISELDKRMQMFTVTEVLSRLDAGYSYATRPTASAPTPSTPTLTSSKISEPSPSKTAAPESAAKEESTPNATSEIHGTDQPWRERMREKYGLKKKPGKV